MHNDDIMQHVDRVLTKTTPLQEPSLGDICHSKRAQLELNYHFAMFEHGNHMVYKGMVQANIAAFQFYMKMKEVRNGAEEQRISIKDCAREYCNQYGLSMYSLVAV